VAMAIAVPKERRRRRTSLRVAQGVATILLVGAAALPAFEAAANHSDNCEGSEPGPNNAPTLVVGSSGGDRCLVGANGPDTIRGRGGDDVLIGNHGPDLLIGGPGDDRFWGGRGPDVFICGPGSDRVNNRRSTGNDIIDRSCEVVR
jgi:Ca2+-binding RTX toxin-like protein